MGKTIREIYNELSPGAFAIKNESWSSNVYAIVYSIKEPLGVVVKDDILKGQPRPIPDADKPEWILHNNIDLSKYVYSGLFSLDSIVITRAGRNTHFGKTIKEILHNDFGFIKWAIKEHHRFFISDDVINYARKYNFGLSEEDIVDNIKRQKEDIELGVTHHPNDFRGFNKEV